MIIQWQSPALELFPVKVIITFTLFHHGDTAIHGANELA
jgi:hypothetical protein